MQHKITPPDLVTLEGPKLKVLAGLSCPGSILRARDGAKARPSTVRLDNDPGMGAMYVRWIVDGAGPYTVKVRSMKGGRDDRMAPYAVPPQLTRTTA